MNRTCVRAGKRQQNRTLPVSPATFLGEAFRIASGDSRQIPQRVHLVAVIEHCRKLVDALMKLPEVE